MIVLNKYYYGSIARCSCGAVIGYKPEDVSRAKSIRCPICQSLVEVLFDPTYEGEIKDETNVPEQSEDTSSNSGLSDNGGSKSGDSEVSDST